MRPDFRRDVHCILGLPIDAISEAQAVEALRNAVRERRRCFLSTPNLNFAVASLRDAAFRDSVLHSDLNTADGMPIVWIARLLGMPIRERVAGSALFERLRAGNQPPLNVYFFGGPDGVAARACERLNAQPGGLRCVGFDSPGFGTVEEMSTPERIARINASAPDIVVVSLGAKKGQAWIERNQDRIAAPVISHLGAVVNFVAGTVQRAPRIAQAAGLEWAWRIGQEPALWRRYLSDGVALLRLLFGTVIPWAWHLRLARPSKEDLDRAGVRTAVVGDEVVLTLSGAWVRSHLDPMRHAFEAAAGEGRRAVSVDLGAVTHLDGSAIGLLCLLHGACSSTGRGWRVTGACSALQRSLHLSCVDYLLQPMAPTAAREQIAC